MLTAGKSSAVTVISPILEMEANPGESQNGILKIYNETAEPLYLTPNIEAFAAGDETGTPVYLTGREKTDYLGWFKLSKDFLLLPSKQGLVVPFAVTVPLDAVPGGYYAVIFWQTAPQAAKENPAVGISSQVGTLVFLKVKGEVVESGNLAEFKTVSESKYLFSFPVNFLVRFANTGNVHLKPEGNITLKNWLGQTEILPVNADKKNVLPGSIRRFETLWGGSFAGNFWQKYFSALKNEIDHFTFGKYTATLNLTYGLVPQQTVTAQLDFWFIPVNLLITSVFGLVVLIILIKINSKIKKLKNKKANN